jgi:O-antigen/teichoic acid export membrane protein
MHHASMPDEFDPLTPVLVPRPRLGLDLFWAYAAAGAKVLSWVVVTAWVFRRLGAFDLGVLTLARATIGLLNYATVGLAPALVHYMARALAAPHRDLPIPDDIASAPGGVLHYATPATPTPRFPTHVAYSNGLIIALAAGALGFVALCAYTIYFERIHGLLPMGGVIGSSGLVFLLGIGTLLRLLSDVPGAVLQTTGRMWLDYAVLTFGECAWVGLILYFIHTAQASFTVAHVGRAYAASGAIVLGLRWTIGGARQGLFLIDRRVVKPRQAAALLAFGSTVLLGQLADFLYAPTNVILIQHLLGPIDVAYYAPAIQIDAGLLLGVSGLAMVLMPRAAAAHAIGDVATLRFYYLRGTAISLLVLGIAATLVWATSPMLFRVWLGSDLPPTRAILPLVLIHTVIGGSSAVGRSILLGMGKVKAFTTSALIAGVVNVILSYGLVKYGGLGLKGVVLGTICVVVVRCALWMPWYVMRVTRAAPSP